MPEATDPQQALAKILAVDDTPSELALLDEMLGEIPCAFMVATSGEEALALAQRERPDLILLDVMMAPMDGFEVCTRLKAMAETREIPVIFLTARTGTEDIIQGFSKGAVDYVPKPYQLPELIARVRTHLALKQKGDQERRLLAELKQALLEVKNLTGLIPICSACKRIRNDKGYWLQVEEYVAIHTDATFSHGVCPECVRVHYPDYSAAQAAADTP